MRKLYGTQAMIEKLSSGKFGGDDIEDFAYSLRETGIIDDDALLKFQIEMSRGLPKQQKAVKDAGFEIETDTRTELPTIKQKFLSHAARWPAAALGVTYAPLLAAQYYVSNTIQTSNTSAQLLALGGLVAAHTIACGIKPKKNFLAKYSRYALDGITFKKQRRAHWAAHYDRQANALEHGNKSDAADILRQKSADIRKDFSAADTISLPYEDRIVPVPYKNVSHVAGKIEKGAIPALTNLE